MKKIIVFASGGGSNFEVLYRAAQNKVFDGEIVLLVASKAGIGAAEKAARFGIPVFVGHGAELVAEVKKYKPDLICLAGYLKKVPSEILDICAVMNIHPALLPCFGGKGMYGHHVHEAVLKSGAEKSGATVHFVDCEYDSGRIIKQELVPVLPSDTPETLAARVLKVEHKIYPLCVKEFFERFK